MARLSTPTSYVPTASSPNSTANASRAQLDPRVQSHDTKGTLRENAATRLEQTLNARLLDDNARLLAENVWLREELHMAQSSLHTAQSSLHTLAASIRCLTDLAHTAQSSLLASRSDGAPTVASDAEDVELAADADAAIAKDGWMKAAIAANAAAALAKVTEEQRAPEALKAATTSVETDDALAAAAAVEAEAGTEAAEARTEARDAAAHAAVQAPPTDDTDEDVPPALFPPSHLPTAEVPPSGQRFGCFLSHYKVEAASEARWLQQTLEPLLGQRCFLDSDDLLDLSRLRDHVRESACVLLLQTCSVLTRPWCLVELLTAIDAGVPIVGVSVASGAHQYDFSVAGAFMTHLDTALEAEMQEQLRALGVDLSEAAFKLANTLPNIISVALSMNESRAVLSARVSDIVSAMGKAALPVLPADRAAWLGARGAAPKRPPHGRRDAGSLPMPAAIPPDVPTLPEALLPRPDILAPLKARVLGETASATAVTAPPKKPGDVSNTTAAAGLGGVGKPAPLACSSATRARRGACAGLSSHGSPRSARALAGKTTVAAALVRDDDVRLAFDKICWVSVGQAPDTASLQQTLHIQLVNQPLSDAARTDERLALGELIAAAHEQAVLLVLDDGAATKRLNASVVRVCPTLTPLLVVHSVGRVARHASQVHRWLCSALGGRRHDEDARAP